MPTYETLTDVFGPVALPARAAPLPDLSSWLQAQPPDVTALGRQTAALVSQTLSRLLGREDPTAEPGLSPPFKDLASKLCRRRGTGTPTPSALRCGCRFSVHHLAQKEPPEGGHLSTQQLHRQLC